MKKLLAIALALAMLASLAACSGKGSSESPSPSPAASAAPTAPALPTPATDVPQIGAGKLLRVGMECAYAPYNWTQPDDSNGASQIFNSPDYAYGYDVMMAQYVAKKMGYDGVEIHKIEWDNLPIAVNAGEIDCIIAGQSITAEHKQAVDFTTPYYYASIVALTTKDSPFASAKGLSDLKGAKCTSQLNTVWYDTCLPQIEDADVLTAMESAPAMLVALDTGKCNLVVTDQPTALAALVAYPNMVMLDFTGTSDNFKVSEEEINIGISVKKGNADLLDALNAALSGFSKEDFENMMNYAIAVQPLSK